MNRAFYIVGIVFSFFYIGIIGNYSDDASMARGDYYMDLLNGYDSFNSYDYMYGTGVDEITSEAALISLFFILCFIAIDLIGLIKVKTKTMKVMGILGLCFSGIFLFWNFAVMSSPGSMSIDEVGGAFGFYGTIILAFSIVGLVQSVRFFKYPERYLGKGNVPTPEGSSGDLLDT